VADRLNIGCGPRPADGWCNTDLHAPRGPASCFVHDIRDRFPRQDIDAFDYAVAHHVFDMLDDHEAERALANVREILKPGGVLRISTPDIIGGYRAWERGDGAWFPTDGGIDEKFCTWLAFHGTRRSLWTKARWSRGLDRAQYETVRFVVFGVSMLCDDDGICELDSRERESLFIEARKGDE
jgi:SAM-dependent methyltransferase